VELEWGTEDDEYLNKVERNMQKALKEHLPDVVVYNAGTDILEGDRLGGLSISPEVCPDLGGHLGGLSTSPGLCPDPGDLFVAVHQPRGVS
jgi:acetoin utilization deacetylase AcuC-like enzyme